MAHGRGGDAAELRHARLPPAEELPHPRRADPLLRLSFRGDAKRRARPEGRREATKPITTAGAIWSAMVFMGPGFSLREPRDDRALTLRREMTPALTRAVDALARGDQATLAGVPDGFDALVVADLARALAAASEGPAVLVHVARDGLRQQALQSALGFVAPEIEVLAFPAWDCQPYDRISPNTGVTAQRMTTLARLARSRSSETRPRLL